MLKQKCKDRHGYCFVTNITLPVASFNICHPCNSSGSISISDTQEKQLFTDQVALGNGD